MSIMAQSTDFREIPGYFRYLIDSAGNIINRHSGERLSGSVNPAGYHNYRLTDDDGKVHTWGRHRLLGFVFKNPGRSIKSLVVNHLDGIKGQDELSNLEWTDHRGNIEHAGQYGLTDKCKPVSVRNPDTGHVVKYPSVVACARALNLTKDAITHRVRGCENRLFPEGRQYRLGHDDRPWAVPTNQSFGRARQVTMRDLKSSQVLEFDQLSQVANHLGIAVSTASQWLARSHQPTLPGLVQLKWSDDTTPWRDVTDPYWELAMSGDRVPVAVLHAVTGEVEFYETASECAQSHGLSPTALNYRLKSKGQTVFQDGYAYSYYIDSF